VAGFLPDRDINATGGIWYECNRASGKGVDRCSVNGRC
jgi:hypothetical protein